jgi:hypothetical protein
MRSRASDWPGPALSVAAPEPETLIDWEPAPQQAPPE